ncbi:MAG: ROK family protein [Phycisphaerales bacterium]|nr:ROK family protein [Phycisphaerales bacterium]
MPDCTPGLYAGIDLGGTNMQIGIVRLDDAGVASVIGREKRKTKGEQGVEGVLERVDKGVRTACEAAGVNLADLRGVGLGAPGVIDPAKGECVVAVNLKWYNQPIGPMLEARLGRPVTLDNDVNVAVVGEWRQGAARGSDFVLGAWVGTGVGGGLILGGRLYYGHWLSAGEIGHMLALPTAAPGSRSLEHNCSRTAIVDRIVRLIRAGRASMLADALEDGAEKIKSSRLAEAYRQEDELTREVVDHAAELLGIHLGSINSMLALERIVLGGGVTEAIGAPFVELVAQWVRRVSFPDLARGVQVVASELNADAGVMGAAMLAAERPGR